MKLSTKVLLITIPFPLLIALIVLYGFLLNSKNERTVENNNMVINLAGRQRMLSQRISKNSLTYMLAISEEEEAIRAINVIAAIRTHMAKTIADIKKMDRTNNGTFKLTRASIGFLPAMAGTAVGAAASTDLLSFRQTSLKYRNPKNKPDFYEDAVLKKLDRGTIDPSKIYSERVTTDGQAFLRMYKPLIISASCLICHGTADSIPPLIKELYKEDLATGYKLGDIRGVISAKKRVSDVSLVSNKNMVLADVLIFEKTLGAIIDGGSVPNGAKATSITPVLTEQINADLQIVATTWKNFKGNLVKIFATNPQSKEFIMLRSLIIRENQTLLKEMNAAVISISDEVARRVKKQHLWYSYFQVACLLLGCVVFATVYFIFNNIITKPVILATSFAKTVSDGDFSQKLENTKTDEIGTLNDSLNRIVENISGMLKKIQIGADSLNDSSTDLAVISKTLIKSSSQTSLRTNTVAAAAEEMINNMDSVAAASEEAAANVNIVAAAAEEMSSTVAEIAKHTEETSTITAEAVAQSMTASQKVEELNKAAQEINHVTETITEISDQTNLLALNATIEAARAGEAGKGFAVVAHEIKELASQTALATLEIKTKIENVQTTTEETIGEILQVGQVIKNVDNMTSAIASAIEEQKITTQEISQNVSNASIGITEVTKNVAQSSSVSRQIASEVAEVETATQDVSRDSNKINTSAEELRNLATNLTEMLKLFKCKE